MVVPVVPPIALFSTSSTHLLSFSSGSLCTLLIVVTLSGGHWNVGSLANWDAQCWVDFCLIRPFMEWA